MSTSGVACVNSNATAGELVDLAAKGAQDVLLTCDPKCSLFHQSYCRITNFAMGEQTITFQNAPSGQNWGAASNMRAEVLRAGDLLGPVYLDGCLSGLPVPTEVSGEERHINVKLWTPAVGFALVQQTRANIGAQNFETIESEYLMMHDEVSRAEGLRASKMVGDYGAHLRGCGLTGTDFDGLSALNSDEATFSRGIEYSTRSQKVLVPLPHFWTSHAGNYLNVVGAQYHNIVLELDIRPASEVKIAGILDRATGSFAPRQSAAPIFEPVEDTQQGVLSGLSILAVYIQLDTAERRLKAQAAQTMRMVYVQGAQYPTVATDAGTTKQISNFFNHPTTRYLWAWRAASHTSLAVAKPEWFEFGGYRAGRYFLQAGAAVGATYYPVQEVVPEIQQFELQINNHSRVHQAAEYFLYAQPYQHAKRVPDRMVYSYSFAMYPEAADMHSGSMNQSRIDNIVLRFTFKPVLTSTSILGIGGNADLAVQNSLAGLNKLQISVDGTPRDADNDPAELADGSSAGTIFFYSEAINFYKQAAGIEGYYLVSHCSEKYRALAKHTSQREILHLVAMCA